MGAQTYAYFRAIRFFFHVLRSGKIRMQLLMLIIALFLAFAAVLDLIIIKIISSELISPSQSSNEFGRFSRSDIYTISSVLAFYIFIRAAEYNIKLLRVTACDYFISQISIISSKLAETGWVRALFLETLQSIILSIQCAALAIFSIYIFLAFGVFVSISLFIQYMMFFYIYHYSYSNQKRLRYDKKTPKQRIIHDRLMNRIRSSERGALISSATTFILFAILLILAGGGWISSASAITLLFLIRIFSNFSSMLAGSMTRMARAQAWCDELFPTN